MTITLIQSDARHIPLASGSVHCVVTSPPYWGLRDYGTAAWTGGDPDCDHKDRNGRNDKGRCSDDTRPGNINQSPVDTPIQFRHTCRKCGAQRQDRQLGLEPTPDCLGWATGAPCGTCYVCGLVQVFREVRRVLRDDGVCFLNLGDSYASTGGLHDGRDDNQAGVGAKRVWRNGAGRADGIVDSRGQRNRNGNAVPNLKPKNLIGIPWRVALALQADGWWLRSDIIWHKTAPMPESVTDRPTRSHEFVFLLSKSARYFYDADAIRGGLAGPLHGRGGDPHSEQYAISHTPGAISRDPFRPWGSAAGRNQRDVWTLGPSPYPGAHFATFPPELPRRCILAGTSAHGVCPTCGAPWKRAIEHSGGDTEAHLRPKQTAGMESKTSTLSLSGNGSEEWAKRGARKFTTGWLPSCTCSAGDPVPATVLDPFVGSGTTLMVARALGRNGIGLDLSADYLQQARQRLDLDKLDAWHGAEQTQGAMDDFDALPLFAA